MIFVDNEQKIRETLKEAIHKVGVEEGDIVLVHSDITPIVHLGDLKEWKKQSKFLNQNFAKFLIGNMFLAYTSLYVTTLV